MSDSRNWDGIIGSLFLKEEMSDVTFIVNGQRICAHKLPLAAASPVFKAMFYGPLSYADKIPEVEISDCEMTDAFEALLELIYTGNASITWENARSLSYLVDKYMIKEIAAPHFKRLVSSSIGTYNSLDFLEKSLFPIGNDEMSLECLKTVRKDISILVTTDRFLDLKREALDLILASDCLYIPEIDLFNAVDRWCSHQVAKAPSQEEAKSKKEVLGTALYSIRFAAISVKDLATFCVPSGLISKDQFYHLVRFNALELSEDKRAKIPKIQKQNRTMGVITLEIGFNTEQRSNDINFQLTVNKKIYFKGFCYYKDNKTGDLISVTVDGKLVQVSYNALNKSYVCVFLKEPALICPHATSAIRIQIQTETVTITKPGNVFGGFAPNTPQQSFHWHDLECSVSGKQFQSFHWHDLECSVSGKQFQVGKLWLSVFDDAQMTQYLPEHCIKAVKAQEPN